MACLALICHQLMRNGVIKHYNGDISGVGANGRIVIGVNHHLCITQIRLASYYTNQLLSTTCTASGVCRRLNKPSNKLIAPFAVL